MDYDDLFEELTAEELSIEEMEDRIDDYFEKLTDEELSKALELANYDYYKHVKTKSFTK